MLRLSYGQSADIGTLLQLKWDRSQYSEDQMEEANFFLESFGQFGADFS